MAQAQVSPVEGADLPARSWLTPLLRAAEADQQRARDGGRVEPRRKGLLSRAGTVGTVLGPMAAAQQFVGPADLAEPLRSQRVVLRRVGVMLLGLAMIGSLNLTQVGLPP